MRIGAVLLFEQSFCKNTTGHGSQCRELAATLQANLELSIEDTNEAETNVSAEKHGHIADCVKLVSYDEINILVLYTCTVLPRNLIF